MSQQQPPMNMGGVPPNAGTPTNTQTGPSQADYLKKLNTYIYDYFLRNGNYEVARAMTQELPGDMKPGVKQSPNMRQGPQQNGVDDDADSKDTDQGILKRPDDLPLPDLPGVNQGPFLQDWWCQFWDIWTTHRGKGKNNSITYSFVGHQRQAQKARNNMAANAMDPQSMNNMRQMNYMQMNGGRAPGPNDLQRAAMTNQGKNLNPQQMAQLQMQRQQAMMGNQMERQGSQMDMAGPRSNSPGSGEAPSPKRQRLDGNMQQMQGRPPLQTNQVGPPATSLPSDDPRAVQTEALLRSKGIDPARLEPETLLELQQQPANYQSKSIDSYSHSIQRQMQAAMQNHTSNINKGMPPNPAAMGPAGAQGSPMSQSGMDNATADQIAYANGHMRLPPSSAAAAAAAQNGAHNQQGGNHALQDYQMQLMLLEQQNKKRLLMARQEQDSMTNPGQGPNGQVFQAPQMSPSGSRQGPSPNPNEMQRGTPKMGKAGLSPNGEMVGRGSPAPGFDPNQIPLQLRQQMMMQGPNGQPMMRPPPSSHPQFANGQQMDPQQMALMQQAQRMQQMPNGQWQGGPQMPPQMMPGQQPGQGPPNSTPRMQGNQMPPPPAPPAGQSTQPGSPAQQPAPPTPSQTNKPKPGSKKDSKASKKGGNKKNNTNTGATPASEAEQPPTPTPATPATPAHANSFAHNKNQQLPNGGNTNQQIPTPQQQPQQLPNHGGAPPVQQPGPPSNDLNNQPFGHLGEDMSLTGGFDFTNPMDGGTDVLDNFDFDSFLNAGEDSFGGFGDMNGVDFGDGLQAEMGGQ